MAVKLKEHGDIIFRPYGMISKEDIDNAEKLDELLDKKIPKIVERTKAKEKNQSIILKWHFFGCELAKIVDDKKFVRHEDIESGDIWLAIRQKLPKSGKYNLGLKSNTERKGARDHIHLCYQLSKFEKEDIEWLQRWHDWETICYKRDSLANKNVLKILGEHIRKLKTYPKDSQFRALINKIDDGFSHTEINLLKNNEIKKNIAEAIKEVLKSAP